MSSTGLSFGKRDSEIQGISLKGSALVWCPPGIRRYIPLLAPPLTNDLQVEELG
jgi:hypothetical protein